jgi:hypothetical protein
VTQDTGTRTVGSATKVFGWVEKSQVEEFLHASDGFQLLLAITLAGIGATAAAVVALAAGALHPIAMYLLLCALLAGTAVPAIMTIREYRRYKQVRARLTTETVQMPVPMMLTISGPPNSGPPTFYLGGQNNSVIREKHAKVQEDVAATPGEAPSQGPPSIG